MKFKETKANKKLMGKNISILGDSISTYRGASNDVSSNATIASNPYFYMEPFPIEATYWMRLIESLDMKLCVNNSWSGGNLSGTKDENSGVNRAKNLSRDNGEKPHFIIVFMGLNDLGRGVDVSVFAADYEKTLAIIKNNYPNASVCCVNLPDRDIRLKKRAELFNNAIDKAVSKAGDDFFVADLFNNRLNNDFYYMNTVDGLHPDEDGMKIIAEVIETATKSHIGG